MARQRAKPAVIVETKIKVAWGPKVTITQGVSSKKAVSSRKSPLAQLGAYARMWQQWHPKVRITECVTVISGPEKCKVRRHSPEDDCIPAWEECWGKFQALQPVADF